MALSDDKLWDMWNAQGTDDMSKAAAFIFARAIEAEVRKADDALIRQLVEALGTAKPVHANSRNTPEVRTGHSMGGFVKHYIVPTHVVNILLTAGRARLEGKP